VGFELGNITLTLWITLTMNFWGGLANGLGPSGRATGTIAGPLEDCTSTP